MRIYLALGIVIVTAGCMVAPYTKFMASDVRVRIVKSGEPVADAIVTREVGVQGGSDHDIQHATTARDGFVNLPAITRVGIVQSIGESVFTQKWTVQAAGKTFLIWEGGKVGTSSTVDEGPRDLLQVFGGDLVYVFDIERQEAPKKRPKPSSTVGSVPPTRELGQP